MNVLVVDVGGSYIKLLATGEATSRRFESGTDLTARECVKRVLRMVSDWNYDVVSLGYPGQVGHDGPIKEPANLGSGWVGFDFERAFKCPVKVVNDAVMQALGEYDGGRMLFLGLGTGLGSALVSDRVLVTLELGSLPWGQTTLADRLGKRALLDDEKSWRQTVATAVPYLRTAVVADYVVVGGGNQGHLTTLPEHARGGGNEDAFAGGFRLWEEDVEPAHSPSSHTWRVIT
jgi:polyphosphate glucokinase